MKLLQGKSVKYKLLSFEELVINLDRLSRFKLPEYSYNRVFTSILTKCLISPKYSNDEIQNLDAKYISKLVKEIWNTSVKSVVTDYFKNIIPNKALKESINYIFKDIDARTKTFINTDLNFSSILSKLNPSELPINLKFLYFVNKYISNENFNIDNLIILRNKYKLLFPVEKILIVEGITEVTILPVFADYLSYNFDKLGIYVLSAGGKSKSPSLYLKLKDKLKIPVVLLFDADAYEICHNLNKFLLKKDKCILINEGEIEDIISRNLIKRSLNTEYEPASPLSLSELNMDDTMCHHIENFYRTRHLGEYKKSKVAKILSDNVKYDTDISDEIRMLLKYII
ncbi:hypothetical protein IJ182_04610 [bacterium]|nr:hypothetical protein [bacterium]